MTAFILAIVGIVISCWPLGVVAIVMGRGAQRDVDAAPGRYSNAGLIRAAIIIGWIQIGLMALALLFILLVFVFGGLSAMFGGPR